MILGLISLTLYLIFIGFSWILFLREELELAVIKLIYPQFSGSLTVLREFFLSHGLNSYLNALFAVFVIMIFLFYFLAIRNTPRLKIVIVFAVLFQLVTFISYPIFSSDIYDYVLNSKVTVEYHKNVWITPPIAVVKTDDIFLTFGRWKDLPSPYGLTHHLVYDFLNRNSPNSFFPLVINFKLVGLIFGLLSIFITYKILKSHYPDKISKSLTIVFWNPLLVWDIASSSHNNIIMSFFMLVSLFFYKDKKFFWAGLAIALATQMKYVPAILAIFLVLSLVRSRKIKEMLHFLSPFLAVNLIGLLLMGEGGITYLISSFAGGRYYWQSLHYITNRIYPEGAFIYVLVFVCMLIVQLFRGLKKNADPSRLYLETLLFYLLFITGFYWNWYVLWLLPFIIFLPFGRLSKTILIFTFTSSLAHPIYWLLLRFYPNEFWTQVIIYLLLAGLPAVYYIFYDRISKKVQI